ncbi:hypothetical protein OUZ56_005587 [Daphnia magna]|uniref:Uncharacterized protein n=1 Tax=Daphnia magna TaxID=35525 RepID=A0ABQ9YTE2_9CRUS|nr:hypothetical protein OUZ56_005587 [Daphnia magna]
MAGETSLIGSRSQLVLLNSAFAMTLLPTSFQKFKVCSIALGSMIKSAPGLELQNPRFSTTYPNCLSTIATTLDKIFKP